MPWHLAEGELPTHKHIQCFTGVLCCVVTHTMVQMLLCQTRCMVHGTNMASPTYTRLFVKVIMLSNFELQLFWSTREGDQQQNTYILCSMTAQQHSQKQGRLLALQCFKITSCSTCMAIRLSFNNPEISCPDSACVRTQAASAWLCLQQTVPPDEAIINMRRRFKRDHDSKVKQGQRMIPLDCGALGHIHHTSL